MKQNILKFLKVTWWFSKSRITLILAGFLVGTFYNVDWQYPKVYKRLELEYQQTYNLPEPETENVENIETVSLSEEDVKNFNKLMTELSNAKNSNKKQNFTR